ncbi:YitT family protein [Sediminibacterium sp. TEGAF015]|uniref:YitT family protein n=1 Tax=Sediminibacterium sp. TEGAF015 TaxID=575378 RepID=UPI00220C2587|nr:YitT family protein [Sediminibacterium sp. TEGAF015]BDQ11885.1 membrane protein [Sediminibacterium sp. TEGAF015]
MHQFLKNLIVRSVLNPDKKNKSQEGVYSAYQIAKGLRIFRVTIFAGLKDALLIFLGVLSAAFGLKGFLLTNHFIDGGATGISLLISALSGVPVGLLILLVNIPFLLFGYRILGTQFAIKSAIAILLLSLTVHFVEFPDITKDNLLVAVFGGFFLGAGIGLSIRGGGVLDGTEVLAIAVSRKSGMTIGDVIIVINVLIFSTAAYFLSVEIAMYSLLTYLSASKTLDFIIEGLEEYTGVTIISVHNDEVRAMIINILGRGVTVYKGKRGYGKSGDVKDMDIVYTVITRLEINKLNTELEKIDPNAFVVMSSIKDTKGGMIKRRGVGH